MVESGVTQVSPISAPQGPREVVSSFLRLTVDTPNLEKAKLHLTRRSRESGMMEATPVPAGSSYTLGAEEAHELGRMIPVNMKSPVDGNMQEMTVPVVVIEEEGAWKIDLPATMEKMMGGMMSALGSAIGGAMEKMGEAMSGALSAATGTLENLAEHPPEMPTMESMKKTASRAAQKARDLVRRGEKAVMRAARQTSKAIKAAPKTTSTKPPAAKSPASKPPASRKAGKARPKVTRITRPAKGKVTRVSKKTAPLKIKAKAKKKR